MSGDRFEEMARTWLDENRLAYHYGRDSKLSALLRRVAEEAQQAKLPCGHFAVEDDSYGGCAVCALHKGIDEAESELSAVREQVRRLSREARAMLDAVTFATPMNMGGTEAEPNMCYPARVPVAFVTGLRAALAETAQEEEK